MTSPTAPETPSFKASPEVPSAAPEANESRSPEPAGHTEPCSNDTPPLPGPSGCPPEAGAGQAGGVVLSNTPPQSSHWTGSEDWLEWGAYVTWPLLQWVELRQHLEHFKALAAGEPVLDTATEWVVLGAPFVVEPAGMRLGDNSKGPYFAYRGKWNGISIMIADCTEPRGKAPNVFVRVDGEHCLLLGASEALCLARSLIQSLGGLTREDKLSRVDIALDMPGVGIKPFLAAFNEGRYICRAKSISYRKSSGVTLGYGGPPLQLRIYDKLKEVVKHGNALKIAAMIQRRWGGRVPDKAVRVEFELRRDALKMRGIDSVADYYAKRSDLVHYLTHEWFWLTASRVDRENKNQSRAVTLPLWSEVQTSFEAWAGTPAGLSLAPLDRDAVDPSQLVKQILGLGKTIARYRGTECTTHDELVQSIVAEISAR